MSLRSPFYAYAATIGRTSSESTGLASSCMGTACPSAMRPELAELRPRFGQRPDHERPANAVRRSGR